MARRHPEYGDSIRGWAERTGISRDVLLRAIARGELEAARLATHRFFVSAEAFNGWLRRHAVVPTVEQRAAP